MKQIDAPHVRHSSCIVIQHEEYSMKKVTKQRIMVLFIAAVFILSSVAFVANLGTPEQGSQVLTNFVVDGELSQATETAYLSKGFTIMKVYYPDENAISYVNNLPDNFLTPSDQVQLIVEKIKNQTEKITLTGPRGEEEITNSTQEKVIKALCDNLYYAPPECILITGKNVQPNQTNFTG